jgi:hypothetical protein
MKRAQRIITVLVAFSMAGCAVDPGEPGEPEAATHKVSAQPSWPVASLAQRGYRVPAEWEPMESVWLAWAVTGPIYDVAAR